jgi:hypothetical protein
MCPLVVANDGYYQGLAYFGKGLVSSTYWNKKQVTSVRITFTNLLNQQRAEFYNLWYNFLFSI